MLTMRLIRLVTPGSRWPVSRERALELARAEVQRRGLPWLEPVRVYRYFGNWAVWTHALHKGGNLHVEVCGQTGAVIDVRGPTRR